MIDDCRSYCYSEMELSAMVDAKMTFIRPSNIGIQSTLVISNSKGLSEILRDIS